MRRPPECPRCPHPVSSSADGWSCQIHGEVAPLWRPGVATYDDLADHLRSSPLIPSYLPWPLAPGWQLTDFAVVGAAPERARATLTCCSGSTDQDGPVDVVVVTEEVGTGLGARCAGLTESDPGREVAYAAPVARLRIGGIGVALWPVATSTEVLLDRAVLAGEAGGRWLWLVLRPASAMLLLHSELALFDISTLGPALVEIEFGGPPPVW
ncbi:MAG: DUF6758 family protein [Nocardioides sp.]